MGELTFDSEFYDYETKYTAGKAEMHIPAKIPEAISDRARALALEAFRALDCAGLARVDFFYLDSTGELFPQRGEHHARFYQDLDVPRALARRRCEIRRPRLKTG